MTPYRRAREGPSDPSGTARAGTVRDQARHRRAGRDARAGPRLPACAGPPADRGRAGPRQDADDQDDGRRPRRYVCACPVHPRPGSLRPRRHADLPAGRGHLRYGARPGLLQLLARRRDQPCAREGSIGPARGDAGAAGHDRTHDLRGARAVPRDGDAEPDRIRRHLPAARGAGRPVHAEDPDRLSGARRGADDRAAPARRAAGAASGALARRPEEAAAARRRHLRRPGARQLRRRPRNGDTAAGRRPEGVHRLRREPARADQPRPGVPGAGADPRTRLRARRGPTATGEGRHAAPARPHLPSAGRGDVAGRDPRPRAGRSAGPGNRSGETERRVTPFRALRAEPTPERPGPGPLPDALLRALEVSIGRRIGGLLAGEYRSTLLGEGTELAQVRPYVAGDDVRHIDWNVTARTGEPHVRVHLAERVLVTWLVLDTSPSMRFGTAERRKADVAEGVAIAVGHIATRRGNRLGFVTFGDGGRRWLPPRQGRLGLIGLLSALREEREAPGRVGATELGVALRRIGAMATQRAVVIVVSDFRGPFDWKRPLVELAGRHEVVAVEIRDPREQELPNAGVLWLVDPETGRQVRADTRSAKLRARFAAAAAEERAQVARALASASARHVVLSTSGDWLRTLAVFLRRGWHR